MTSHLNMDACPVAGLRSESDSKSGAKTTMHRLPRGLFIISIFADCQPLDKPLCETKCKIYSDRILRDSLARPKAGHQLCPSERQSLSSLRDRCNILSITLAAVAAVAEIAFASALALPCPSGCMSVRLSLRLSASWGVTVCSTCCTSMSDSPLFLSLY